MTVRLTRPLGAALLLAGGIVHYNLWQGGYRHIHVIGPLFLANFVGSAILALVTVGSRRRAVSLPGIVFAAGSLAALVLSRTVGIFGFTEAIWTAPAIKAVLSEAGAMTILGLDLVLQLRAPPPRTAARTRCS
jgi:hypothetical protein